jgi:pilus assembly protein CpaE
VPVYPPAPTVAELIQTHQPNLCVLDTTSAFERAMATVADILAANPRLPVVTLLGDSNPDLILRCLREGASEFLTHPFSADQVGQVLDRVAKKLGPQQDAQARVYCLVPSKGGCGATTIASNLAFQIKRLGAKRVLLADLDPLTGTLSFILKLKSNYSFIDAVSHKGGMDPDIWKALIVQSGGIDILLSPEAISEAVHEVKNPEPLLEFVRGQYDAVVIDTGGVYGEWGVGLARGSDEVLLVSTNELPALQATQRARSYMDAQRVDRAKVRLIVNRYNRDVGLSKEVIETALHEEVYHLLPSDYDSVQRALIDGRPIPPGSSLGKALVQLGDRLHGQYAKKTEPEPAAKPAGGGSTWASLLRMIRGTNPAPAPKGANR